MTNSNTPKQSGTKIEYRTIKTANFIVFLAYLFYIFTNRLTMYQA